MGGPAGASREVLERMVWRFLLVADELGIRLGDGLGISPDVARAG